MTKALLFYSGDLKIQMLCTPWHSDSVKTEKLTESVLQIWPSTEYAINLAELVEKWPSIRIFSPRISLSYFWKLTESDLDFIFSPSFWLETHRVHRVHSVAGFLTEFATERISPSHCARGY